MGGFKIYRDNYADFTVISNKFIDEYMEDANDAQLKIYLYLMRMINADLCVSISDIADRFNYTEKDVMRALRYWEKKGLIALDFDASKQLSGVHMLPLSGTGVTPVQAQPASGTMSQAASAAAVSEQVVSAVVPSEQPAAAEIIPVPRMTQTVQVTAPAAGVEDAFPKPVYSKDELLGFKSRESSSQLIFVAESYLHKALSVAELSTIFYISDTLHFSDDLIDYLLQYCVGREKTDYRYIEAVARDWAGSGITTPKQAAAHAKKYDRIVYEVMNALGKSSAPSNIEISFINKWTHDFAYDMSVIGIACERTVLNTDRKRFNYADSILSRWHDLGVRNKSDIDRLDPPKKKQSSPATTDRNRFNQFSQNSYDYTALEQKLISN